MAERAIRLIFDYQTDIEGITLVSQQIVDTIAHQWHTVEGREGYFIDIYDADDNLIVRRYAYGAFATHGEFFPKGERRQWLPLPTDVTRTFSVLLPWEDNADHIKIVHVAPDPQHMLLRKDPISWAMTQPERLSNTSSNRLQGRTVHGWPWLDRRSMSPRIQSVASNRLRPTIFRLVLKTPCLA
jgi:hypothetical protein